MAPERASLSYSSHGFVRAGQLPPGLRRDGGPADDQFRPEPADVFRLGRGWCGWR